jgi:putative addiction module CopG family antidote
VRAGLAGKASCHFPNAAYNHGTMKVSLPDDLINFVREERRSGRYKTNSDVVCDALRLLRTRRQEAAALKRLLNQGWTSESEPCTNGPPPSTYARTICSPTTSA